MFGREVGISRLQLWSGRQRVALIVIVLGLLIYLTVRFILNPTFVQDPQPLDPPRAAELADRIDPNTADVDTLAALPTLGEKRAKQIVDYREHYRAMFPNDPCYQKLEDLMRIRGIGVATIDQLRPFLEFPTAQPATQATSVPATQRLN